MTTATLPVSHAPSLASPRQAREGASSGVMGGVRAILRAEGLAILSVAVALYFRAGCPGGTFAALFLVPDLGLLGYLVGRRMGALTYNATHSLLGPLALGVAGLFAAPGLVPYALIWMAHVGFDRALGYGLKYGTGFGQTHLGRIGRAADV